MRCLLNEKKILSIKAGNKRQEFWDSCLLGFGMRVTKTGQKTFFVMCRDKDKQRRISLGRYPLVTLAEARDAAQEKLRLVTQGHSLEVKKQESISLQTVFESFVEIHIKKKNKDWKVAEARLRNTLVAEYGSIDIRNISREHIITLLDKTVARNAPTQANRIHAGSSKFFRWAAERGYIENSPMLYLTKPSKENPRDRVLFDDELRLVWNASENMTYPFGPLLQILILTGQRKGEVAGMKWSEINFKEKVWTLPKERAKNGQAHSVPLTNHVLKILESVPRFLHSDYVFTTTGKTPVSGFGKIKSRLDEKTEVKDWILHDLRRTVASGMARLKVAPHVVEKILNHVSGTFSGVAGVYNRYGYDDEKREALNLWDAHIKNLTLSLDISITSD